jgi:chromosome segregation ATPase
MEVINMSEKPIFFRLEKIHMDKLDEKKGDKNRNAYCKDIIIKNLYVDVDEVSTNVAQEIESLESELRSKDLELQSQELELQSKESELQSKNNLLLMCSERVKDLQKDIGFLQLEYQKLTDRLMLPAAKSWWQFWKK